MTGMNDTNGGMTLSTRFEKLLSPSKLGEIEACPCYYSDPNRPRGEAADEGDRMHKAFETGDVSGLDEQEQRDAVAQCLQYCETLAPRPFPKDGRTIGAVTEYDRVLDEVWLTSDIGKRGKADKLIFPANEPDHAHLVDAKMGKVPVAHAKDNAQGIDYAYRVFLNYPHINRVTVHFVLPRQQDVTMHTFHRDPDYMLLRQRIYRVHERYNDPFKQPTPNFDKACAYCDLKARCPALGASAVSVARKLQLLPLPDDFAPDQPRTPEERGLGQDLADLLIKWGEDVRRNNANAVKLGAEAEGYRLQSKRGSVTVEDAAGFIDAICEKFDVTPADLVRAAGTVSLADTVQFLRSRDEKLDAKDLRGTIESTLGAYLKMAPEFSYLVRERKGKKKEVRAALEQNAEEAARMRAEIAGLDGQSA